MTEANSKLGANGIEARKGWGCRRYEYLQTRRDSEFKRQKNQATCLVQNPPHGVSSPTNPRRWLFAWVTVVTTKPWPCLIYSCFISFYVGVMEVETPTNT